MLNFWLYFTTTALNWFLPQIYSFKGRDANFVGIITSIQAFFCVIASIITPFLNKYEKSTVILQRSLLMEGSFIFLHILSIEVDYLLAVIYALSFLFFGSEMQLLFVMTLSSVSAEDASIIAGVPTCSRTVG